MLSLYTRPHRINRLRNEVDRLFDGFFGDVSTRWAFEPFSGRSFPALNVWEDDNNLYAEAELPGLSIDDVEVVATRNELSLKSERKDETKGEGVAYHRRERNSTAFSRNLRLPVDIDPDQVKATLKDGVLTITLPKAATARAHKIEVKALTS